MSLHDIVVRCIINVLYSNAMYNTYNVDLLSTCHTIDTSYPLLSYTFGPYKMLDLPFLYKDTVQIDLYKVMLYIEMHRWGLENDSASMTIADCISHFEIVEIWKATEKSGAKHYC